MTTAYLFVLDTMADWEPGFLTAELNTGRMFREPGTRVPVRTVGLTEEPVTTMGGMCVRPDLSLAELDPTDAAVLVLPGAEVWLAEPYRPVTARAAEFLAAGVPVAAICGATLALAEAGLLDNRPHTSNDLTPLRQACPNYRGEAHYVDAPAVTDGNLVTASGTAPIEFARHVLARLGVLSEESLEAWYQLYKTGLPEHYVALARSLPQPIG